MRLLFFTDTHIRGTSPRNRKDNFFETLKNKFLEIKSISQRENIDYILHGGDWFDRPDISPAVVREFAVILKSFEKPIYTIAGNHDIFGQNPETIGRTMLGLLEGLGVMKLLDYEDAVILEKGGVKVQLTGKPYNYDIDGDNFKEYYLVKKRKDVDYAVNIVHGMLLVKPFIGGMRFTLLDKIFETEADITLSGHYHTGFGVKKSGEKYFINPGSLVRVTNYLSEMSRKPKVVIMELGKDIVVREVELECALPGEEVLDREELEASMDRNQKLGEFYETLKESGSFEKVELGDIINYIAADRGLSTEVKDEAIRRISEAREKVSRDETE